MEPKQFKDEDFGLGKVLYEAEDILENVCLFASHTHLPRLPEYVYYYLNEIKKASVSIVFISSSGICESDLDRLSQLSSFIIEKENLGTDFGAWCSVLRQPILKKKFKNLYLCNDSVFGPFISFKEMHKIFMQRSESIMGITDSFQGTGYHIQSYFIGVKQEIIYGEAWKSFWNEMKFLQEKKKVIDFYEIGLTQKLLKAGHTCFIWSKWSKKIDFYSILDKVGKSERLRQNWLKRVLLEKENIIYDINPSSFIWKELIVACNDPFIKRELFIYNHLYEECEMESQWEKIILGDTAYPIELIKTFLIQYFFWKSWQGFTDYPNLRFSISLSSDELKSRDHKNPVHNYSLFESLNILFGGTKKVSNDLPLFSRLRQSNIQYSVLSIQNTKEIFQTILVYLDRSVVDLVSSDIYKIKRILRECEFLIITTPNESIKHIVSKIFDFRQDRIIVEEDLFNPANGQTLGEELRQQYDLFLSGKHKLNLYNRPSLTDIVHDAITGENRTDFIKQHNVDNNQHPSINNEKITDQDAFFGVQIKYNELYEFTPLWYKKLGHIIKLFKGNKKLTIKITDKGGKDFYNQTAEDLAYWYYLQYEVLPKWYKSFGKKLIKRKNNDDKMSNMSN